MCWARVNLWATTVTRTLYSPRNVMRDGVALRTSLVHVQVQEDNQAQRIRIRITQEEEACLTAKRIACSKSTWLELEFRQSLRRRRAKAMTWNSTWALSRKPTTPQRLGRGKDIKLNRYLEGVSGLVMNVAWTWTTISSSWWKSIRRNLRKSLKRGLNIIGMLYNASQGNRLKSWSSKSKCAPSTKIWKNQTQGPVAALKFQKMQQSQKTKQLLRS